MDPGTYQPRIAVVDNHPENRQTTQPVEFGQVGRQPRGALKKWIGILSAQACRLSKPLSLICSTSNLPASLSSVILRRVLPGRELPRALRCAHHGLDESDAQAAFFQFEDAVDGTSSGGGYGVFQQGRVIAGFEHHL